MAMRALGLAVPPTMRSLGRVAPAQFFGPARPMLPLLWRPYARRSLDGVSRPQTTVHVVKAGSARATAAADAADAPGPPKRQQAATPETFAQLGVMPALVEALDQLGIHRPTEIQASVGDKPSLAPADAPGSQHTLDDSCCAVGSVRVPPFLPSSRLASPRRARSMPTRRSSPLLLRPSSPGHGVPRPAQGRQLLPSFPHWQRQDTGVPAAPGKPC